MARILVTGASGFIGWNLAGRLSRSNEVWGTYRSNPVRIERCRMERLDLGAEGDAARVIGRIAPDTVIHAAALIDVDRCERERKAARRVNEEGTGQVAEAAARLGARLIYISTDMVFDGGKGMYTEEDEPRPICVYGATKLAGEKQALDLCPSAVVFRVSLVYGWGNGVHESFLRRMLAVLERGEEYPAFTDQFRTPTFVGDIAGAVDAVLERPGARGVFHVSGPDRLSRFEMGKIIARAFGIPQGLIRPVTMAELKGMIVRPRDISLDNGRAVRDLGVEFTGFEEGLSVLLRGGV